MLTSSSHDFGPLLSLARTRVGLICLSGVLANYGFTLIMATVSQRFTRSLRNQLFVHAKSCRYVTMTPTNMGTSCLSIPMILMPFAKRLNNPFSTLYPQRYHPWGNDYADGYPLLFLIVLFSWFIVMVFIIKDVSGKSGRYFGAQQKNLGTALYWKKWCLKSKNWLRPFVWKRKHWGFWPDQWPTLWSLPTRLTAMPMSSCRFLGTWEMFPLF